MSDRSFEGRQSPRIGLEVRMKASSVKADSKIFGWMLDLSHGGLRLKAEFLQNFKGIFHGGDEVFFEIKGIFHGGDEVYFETSDEFYNIRGRGRVIWISDEEDIVGIQFDELDERSRKSIDEFLRMCI